MTKDNRPVTTLEQLQPGDRFQRLTDDETGKPGVTGTLIQVTPGRATIELDGTPAKVEIRNDAGEIEREFTRSGSKRTYWAAQTQVHHIGKGEIVSDTNGTTSAKKEKKATIGGLIKQMLKHGDYTDDILTAVKKEFPQSKCDKTHVAFYKNQLKGEGVTLKDHAGIMKPVEKPAKEKKPAAKKAAKKKGGKRKAATT